MDNTDIIQADHKDLVQMSELYEPMLYYGSGMKLSFDYVSDIHLLHHIESYGGDLQKEIKAITKSLYESRRSSVHLFLGDISSNSEITVEFYRQFKMREAYRQYKFFRRYDMLSDETILAIKQRRSAYENRLHILERYMEKQNAEIKRLTTEINKYVNYKKVIEPKGTPEQIEQYLNSKFYKKRNVPDHISEMILIAAELHKEMKTLQESEKRIRNYLAWELNDEPVKLCDFKYKPSLLGYVILGNHELYGFTDVEQATEYYKRTLEPMGYRVLQNEYEETERAVIYGGSGFAKYNERYNANNLKNCKAMMGDRYYEIAQTELFEAEYEKAKEYARQSGKCFVCISHYPASDCLGRYERETVYFSGHTHNNERIRNEEKVLFADNQIGYENKDARDGNITFRKAETGYIRNPFAELEDGCHVTTPEDYLQFYDYIGEYIGPGKLIRQRCESGTLYVIKSCGFYGFFVVGKTWLSIVNGGKTKRIAETHNIEWIHKNFDIVVRKYLEILSPLREKQVQISKELKRLGFRGTIHGLIVDIDFYNHILLNPVDGSIRFYYSPDFGTVQLFQTIQEQLAFMGRTELLEELTPEKSCAVFALPGMNALIGDDNNILPGELIKVSRTEGNYGLSRAISPLQRLFTGHVLRNFDLRLTEIEDDTEPQKKRSPRRGYLE